jgi:hypothetical protein
MFVRWVVEPIEHIRAITEVCVALEYETPYNNFNEH